MKKTKCYSVRTAEYTVISEKAVKIKTFDGREDIFPLSAVFGIDYEVAKSNAYWIASWILEKKNIQYTDKKVAWFSEYGHQLPNYSIEKHVPERVKPVNNKIKELER